MYRVIGNALIKQCGVGTRCVYEPYLWNIPEVEATADLTGMPFNVGQVGLFNMFVHCNTPLFLQGRNQLHDFWLKKVFGPMPSNRGSAPDNRLAKVIRGSGRLDAALSLIENLKVLIITRNVVDTVNSALGLFSFYGDEFHHSDKNRFLREINARFQANVESDDIQTELEWAVLWWHYFTESSFQTYRKYPRRAMLVPYETYVEDKETVMQRILDFLSIERSYLDSRLLDKAAGPSTSIKYLSNNDVQQMNHELDWYFSRLHELEVCSIDFSAFRHALLDKYYSRRRARSPLLTEKTDWTAVQWRSKLHGYAAFQRSGVDQNDRPKRRSDRSITMGQAMTAFGSNELPLSKLRTMRPLGVTSISRQPTLGVLITSHNNGSSIAESIYSVLSQSKKPDVIIVADDCSTDGSLELLQEFAENHAEIQLVERTEVVGVSANRDLAIRQMSVDYITTLDGDDLYLPGKLELEYAALQGSKSKVAFSNIAVLSRSGNFIQDTSAYSRGIAKEMLLMIASRSKPVPRDMMFSRSLFEQAGGFDVVLNIYEDWAFKMRLMSLAQPNTWIWSGGIGTVYDRRSPGLSGREPIFHAHGQLLVVARNVQLLKHYPEALLGGLRTVTSHLDDGQKEKMRKLMAQYESCPQRSLLTERLAAFWDRAYFGNDAQRRRADLETFFFT